MSENLFMVQLSLCISGPFTRCFFPMYCLHIVAKGVRKERRFKGRHDASTFPIPLWFFSLVVLLDHSLLLHFENPKRNVYFLTFPPLFFFLSILLYFHCSCLSCSSLHYLVEIFWNPLDVTRAGKLPFTSRMLERFGGNWFSYSTNHLVANHSFVFPP